jgi:activator of HSP90 ATPase
MAATTTINQTEFIPGVKPQEVYDALVDPRKHTEFTGSKATGQAKVGAKFTAWDGYITGKHLVLEPGKRLVQEWSTSEWPAGSGPSHLEWTFVPKGDGTQVTMVHSEVPADQAESYRQGWIDYYWDPLKQYFEDLQET